MRSYIHNKVVIVLISILFLIIGLGSLFFSGTSFIGSQKFLKNSVITDGNVTDIIQQTNTNSNGSINYTYSPRISFTAGDGKQYTFISSTGGSAGSYQKGESIKILYNPKNPYDAKINNFTDVWGLSIFLLIFGLAFFAFGVLGIIFPRAFAGNRSNQPRVIS